MHAWHYGSGLDGRALRCERRLRAAGRRFAAVGDRPHVRRRSRRSRPPARSESEGPTTEQVLRIERLEAQIRQLTGTIEQLQYRNQQLEKPAPRRGRRRARSPAAAAAGVPPAAAGQPLSRCRRRRSRSRPQPLPAAAAAAAARDGPPLRRVRSVAESQRARRAASARQPCRTSRRPIDRPPSRRSARPAAAAPARRSICRRSPARAGLRARRIAQPQGGPLPPPPSRNLSATGAVAAVAPPHRHAEGHLRSRLRLRAAQGLRAGRGHLPAFLKKYPTDRRAADAQYWLGESLFQRQRYDAAAQAFLELSTKHGSHAKAPDALLRLGAVARGA